MCTGYNGYHIYRVYQCFGSSYYGIPISEVKNIPCCSRTASLLENLPSSLLLYSVILFLTSHLPNKASLPLAALLQTLRALCLVFHLRKYITVFNHVFLQNSDSITSPLKT